MIRSALLLLIILAAASCVREVVLDVDAAGSGAWDVLPDAAAFPDGPGSGVGDGGSLDAPHD